MKNEAVDPPHVSHNNNNGGNGNNGNNNGCYQQGGWGSNSNCGGGLPPMNGHMSMKSKDINGQNNNNNNGNNGTNNNGMNGTNGNNNGGNNGLVAPGSGMGMFVQPNGMTAPGMVSGPGGMMMAAMQGMTGPMGGVMPKQEDGTLVSRN